MNDFWTVVRWLRRGKSLGRTLQNLAFSEICLSGTILDVGGGGKKRFPSYRLFMQTTPDCQWTVADYDRGLQPDLCFDANRNWPVQSQSFDRVLLINCVNLFPEPQFVMHEAARVLRSGGKLIAGVIMITHEVPEPGDYFRCTSQGGRLLAEQAGLTVEALLPYSGRIGCLVDLIRPYLRKLCLFLPAALFAYWLDPVLEKHVAFERRHPLHSGYIVIAHK